MKVSLYDSSLPGDNFRSLKVRKKFSVQIKNRTEDKVLVKSWDTYVLTETPEKLNGF